MNVSINQITIGISIFVKGDGTFGLFENGLRQNVIFLYQLFKSIPNFKVYLLNHGDGEPIENIEHLGVDMADIVRTPTVESDLDYVIAIGAAMDVETLRRIRENGGKTICYKGGNGGVLSMEAVVCNPIHSDAERYFDAGLYDQIWMTPQHIHTYKGWCETLYRCPVFEVPQIWAPTFIHSRPKEIVENFMYQPGEAAKKVGVMDPNITIMKTSHMPILVAEAAYRRAPELLKSLLVTNAIDLADDPHFSSFCNYLTIFKDGIATVEPRFAGADFIANHADAIVTHHWENGLNYLYYEVLYGGYPLIHNSEFIKDFGYYYPSFDALTGGEVLAYALKNHDLEIEEYKYKTGALLAQRHPTSKYSVDAHLRLLEAL